MRRVLIVAGTALLVAVGLLWRAYGSLDDVPLQVSSQTTVITSPLRSDGTPDYAKATRPNGVVGNGAPALSQAVTLIHQSSGCPRDPMAEKLQEVIATLASATYVETGIAEQLNALATGKLAKAVACGCSDAPGATTSALISVGDALLRSVESGNATLAQIFYDFATKCSQSHCIPGGSQRRAETLQRRKLLAAEKIVGRYRAERRDLIDFNVVLRSAHALLEARAQGKPPSDRAGVPFFVEFAASLLKTSEENRRLRSARYGALLGSEFAIDLTFLQSCGP
jgi:hypothetical protein